MDANHKTKDGFLTDKKAPFATQKDTHYQQKGYL